MQPSRCRSIRTGVVLFGVLLSLSLPVGCGGGGGGGGGGGETGAFQVTSTSPVSPFRFPFSSEDGFDGNNQVQLIFSDPIDATSVLDGNTSSGLGPAIRFTHVDGTQVEAMAFVGGYSLDQLDATGNPVVPPEAAKLKDASGEPLSDTILTLVADTDDDLSSLESFGSLLNLNTVQVTVTVRQGARSRGGNPLVQGFCATFNVGLTSPNPPPRVISVSPPSGMNGVPLEEPIQITFSEEVDPVSVAGIPGDPTAQRNIQLTGFQLQTGGSGGGVPVPPAMLTGTIRPTFPGNLCEFTFEPAAPYPGQTVISVNVLGLAPGPNTLPGTPSSPAPITDTLGEPMASTVVQTFITEEGPTVANNPTPPNAIYFAAKNPARLGVVAINAIGAGTANPRTIVDADGDGVATQGEDLVVMPNSINNDSFQSISDIEVGDVITASSVIQNDPSCNPVTFLTSILGNSIDNPPFPNPPPVPTINSTSNCVPSLCSSLFGLAPAIRPNAMNSDLGHYLYVADNQANVVHVVNSTTSLPMLTIPTPDPTRLAVDPDFRFLFVTNFGANTVSVIDIRRSSQTRHTVLQEIPVGRGPRGIDIQPDYEDILVLNANDRTMSIIDAGSFTERLVVPTGSDPWDVVASPRGVTQTYFAFITNRGDDSVSIYESGPSTPRFLGPDGILTVLREGPTAPFKAPMGAVSNRRTVDPRVFQPPGCLFVNNGNRTVAEIRLTAFQPPPLPGFPVIGELRTFEVVFQTDPSSPENPIGEGPTDLALNDNISECSFLTNSNTKAWQRFPGFPLLNESNTILVSNGASGTISILDRRTGLLRKVIDVPGVEKLEAYFP